MDTVFSSGRASPESKQCMSNDDGAEHKLLRCERRKMNYLYRRTASVPRLTRESDDILYGQKQKNSIYLQQWFIQTYAVQNSGRKRRKRLPTRRGTIQSEAAAANSSARREYDKRRLSSIRNTMAPVIHSQQQKAAVPHIDGPEKRRLTHHISTRPVYRVSQETYPVSLPFIVLNNSVKTDLKKSNFW